MASSFFFFLFFLQVSGFLPPFPYVCSVPQTNCLGASFTFPQDHVYDTAEKGQREGHPGQDVGEAIGVVRVEMPFWVPHRVDGRCAHHAQTGKDLEDSSDVKPTPLGEGEELAKEQEQRQNTKDDGQDHGGLDRLQPFVC